MAQLVILQQDVWGGGELKCKGCVRLELFCIALVCWLGWWDHCSTVGRCALFAGLGLWQCNLGFLCQRHRSHTQTAASPSEDEGGWERCSSCWTLSLCSRCQTSSRWMGARAWPAEGPASWIPSPRLPAPRLSMLPCLTSQGNAREVILITSKWVKSPCVNLRHSSVVYATRSLSFLFLFLPTF